MWKYATMLVSLALLALPQLARAQQQPMAETPKGMLAAQIRTQGFVCDKPLRATRDAKHSRPDHEVWTLRCSNATFRVSRAPDMAAKIEMLR